MPSTLNTLHTPLSIATTPCSDYYSTSDSSAPASPQTPDSYVSEEEFSSTLDPHKQHKNLQLNTEAQSESTSTLTKSATRSSSTSSSFSSYSEQIVSDDVCVIMEHGIVWVGKTIEVVEDSVDSEPRSIKSMKSSESFSSSKLTETLSNTSSLDPSSMPAPKLVFPIPSLALLFKMLMTSYPVSSLLETGLPVTILWLIPILKSFPSIFILLPPPTLLIILS